MFKLAVPMQTHVLTQQFADHGACASSTIKVRVMAQRSRSIHEYFTAAYRRAGRRNIHLRPVAVSGEDGLQACFRFSRARGHIRAVDYYCSTCVTLLGLCEHLSDVVLGMEFSEALALTPEVLLEWHPEIPPERRGRADLAIAALRSGLAATDNGEHV